MYITIITLTDLILLDADLFLFNETMQSLYLLYLYNDNNLLVLFL